MDHHHAEHIASTAATTPPPTTSLFDYLKGAFDSSGFMPHGHCYLWRSDVLWLNVGSDLLIALSYFSIPIALIVFVRRRNDLAFNWVFRMFAAFIFACGATHLFEIWAVWNPDYYFQGLLKLFTALISATTAIVLWPLMPKAINLPSPTMLHEANQKLKEQIDHKNKIQGELLESKHNLELRVEQRTSDLRRANKMKDEFLSTLSHELRTPLNVIIGYSDLLRLGETSPDSMKSAIDSIYRNAKIQAELIEDLLDVSRIITGKIQLANHLVDPVTIVDFAIEAVKLSAHAKDIKLETSFASITGFILGDSTRLQQVVWNLLSNAIKFSPKGSTISIKTQRRESRLEIKVIDQGKGIDPEFLPYVFDRFRQEDSSSTRAFGGLGLGLAIVRHIIELHGGMVFADSEGKGKGSCFTIILPVMMTPAAAAEIRANVDFLPPSLGKDPHMWNSKALAGFKVLAIDDEYDTRILIHSILVRCGADAKIAESAEEARKILSTWLPDVIISDVGMSEESGIEFIKKLRAAEDRPESQIPAIALTAYARKEDREEALLAGFQAHASKPIGSPQLIEVILRVLPKPLV